MKRLTIKDVSAREGAVCRPMYMLLDGDDYIGTINFGLYKSGDDDFQQKVDECMRQIETIARAFEMKELLQQVTILIGTIAAKNEHIHQLILEDTELKAKWLKILNGLNKVLEEKK